MSRVIVITGASEGIGALLARRQGAKGDSIVPGARRQDKLNGHFSRVQERMARLTRRSG